MSLKEVADLQGKITLLETKLKELKRQEKVAIEEVVKSGKTSDRWYELITVTRPGNREIIIDEFSRCFPDQFKQVAILTAYIKDAEKVLNEKEMMQVTRRKPDQVSYEIRKKAQMEVIIA
ncbi:MAG: hypothetical protein LLG05_10485 [Porphyromonadaceae bacterium]|nr:hypothetical protein [Porphyromonadaceae bacterium]